MNPLIDANKLYEAGNKTIQSSSFKYPTQLFEQNQLLRTIKLKESIENGIYKPGKTYNFTLNERGKVRDIMANCTIDKVVNHCTCDEIITPRISPYLIYDNCASQKNKGVSKQRKRLKIHLQDYYKVYGDNEGYILLMDFQKYYANIEHQISKDILYDKIKPDQLTQNILDDIYNQFGKGRGVNIGHQVSQDIGILHPYQIDNYFKIARGCKWYGRYTDDSYAFFRTKEEAKEALEKVKIIAEQLGIVLHPQKTRIIKLSQPFYFLKIKYILYKNGCVKLKIHPKTLHREKRKLKKYLIKLNSQEISIEDIDNSFKSWLGSYWKYMYSWQIRDIANLYKQLFGRLPEWKKKRSRLSYLMEQPLMQNQMEIVTLLPMILAKRP